MMIQSWSMQHIRVRFVNLDSGETGYLNPEAMTQGMGRRWSSHPDMVKQYGACVDKKFREMGINNFTLHIDVWRSMNNRFQQRMINPRVDILTAEWSPFKAPSWTMPLLSELSNWRQRLGEIKSEFRKKSDQEEELIPHIVFAADFPGLYLGGCHD
jgi:vitamin K-dependent gamma-carboxylase